jgi:hypothetical protein
MLKGKLLLLLSCTLFISHASAQCLSGVYTIGGSAPDFLTFTEAADSLEANGVCGPVVFMVRPGTYNEQHAFGSIPGASVTNTITFESENGDSTSVILTNTLVSNPTVVTLTNADHMVFRKLTFSTGIGFSTGISLFSGCDSNVFANNVYIHNGSNGNFFNLTPVPDHGNKILQSRFEGGVYGVIGGASATGYETGIEITGNIFHNQVQGAINLQYQDGIIITNNTVTTTMSITGTFHAIGISFSTGNYQISSNTIIKPAYTGTQYAQGIFLNNCTSAPGNEGLVSNNFISLGGTTQLYGIYVNLTDYVKVYNNSVDVFNFHGSSSCFVMYGNNNALRNNIFMNRGGGYAATYSYNSINISSDYNNLHTTGQYLISTQFPTLVSWQNSTPFEDNSLNIPVFFSAMRSPGDLAMNNYGVALPEVTTDLTGNPRSSTPDLGAVEFVPDSINVCAISAGVPTPVCHGNNNVSLVIRNAGTSVINSVSVSWEINYVPQPSYNWTGTLIPGNNTTAVIGTATFNTGTIYSLKAWTSTPNSVVDPHPANDTTMLGGISPRMNGIYTIGGATPDFTTFNIAIASLISRGICGPVTFDVRPGTYNEQVIIPSINGASAANRITFRSENSDSTSVVLQYTATNFTSMNTVKLDGADYITFSRMTLRANGTTYGAQVVRLAGTATHNEFRNNVITNSWTTSGNDIYALVHSISTYDGYNVFDRNVLLNGSHGFYWQTSTAANEYYNEITNNVFINQYTAGFIANFQSDITLAGNIITTSSSNSMYRAISTSGGGADIYGNKITGNGYWGIYITGSASAYNNAIAGGFNYGLSVWSAGTCYLSFNSVNVSGCPLQLVTTNGHLYNNVLVSYSGAMALYTDGTPLVSDHNCFNTNGIIFSYAGGSFPTFMDWQQETGNDQNSFNLDPYFLSAISPRATNISLNGSGVSIPGILYDADSVLRSSPSPDMGAFEFTPAALDAGVISIGPAISCPGNTTITAEVRNLGLNTLNSLTVNWSIDNIPQAPVQWIGNIASGASTTIALGTVNVQPLTSYTVKVFTSNPNGVPDQLAINDTLQRIITGGMSGIYTIGGSLPDFSTFNAAATALDNYGVCGSVMFNVRNGTYNEQVTIPRINGVSSSNTVTFQSESGDSTQVILTFASVASASNYTLSLSGSYVTLKKMTIRNTGTTYSRVISVSAYTHYWTIANCILEGSPSPPPTDQGAVVYTSTAPNNNAVVSNNRIINGSYGISFSGYAFGPLTYGEVNSLLEKNFLYNQTICGILADGQDSLIIAGNVIATTTTNTGYTGISILHCNRLFTVEKNRVGGGAKGITVANCSPAASAPGLLVNNFIQGNSQPLLLTSSDSVNVYYNSICKSSQASGSSARVEAGSSNIVFRNNNMANHTYGEVLYIDQSSTVVSDYNNLYTMTGPLAFIGGTSYNSLASIHTLAIDSHSVSVPPMFASTVNLHTNQGQLDGAGSAIPGIMEDIDGEQRDLVAPDIGADEYLGHLNDVAIVEWISPQSNYMLTAAEPITIKVVNKGAMPKSNIPVYFSVDGGNTIIGPEIISGTLSQNDTAVYTFSVMADFSQFYTYGCISFSGDTSDTYAHNDTIYRAVINYFTPIYDAGVAFITQPSQQNISIGSDTIRAVVKNFAFLPLTSVTINWQIDAAQPVPYLWTGNLLQGSSTPSIALGIHNFTTGWHTIKIWTSNPNQNTDQVTVNDTLQMMVYACGPLSGNYIIGPNSGPMNFSSFGQAVDVLTFCGVSGPVVFDVLPGLYNESISIPPITGASLANTITFQSSNGDSTSVILEHTAAPNSLDHTIRLDGADHIIFKRMTLKTTDYFATSSHAVVVKIVSGASNNSFIGNIFEGISNSGNSTSNSDALVSSPQSQSMTDDNNSFNGNIFRKSCYGIAIYGVDTLNLDAGVSITNNYFEDQSHGAIRIYYGDSLIIKENTIVSQLSQGVRGIRLLFCRNDLLVSRNTVSLQNDGIGFEMYNCFSVPGKEMRIINNFFVIQTTIATISRAMFINTCANFKVYNNSVNATGNNTSSVAASFMASSGFSIMNNVFSNHAQGLAYYFNSNSACSSNYNNVYGTGPNLLSGPNGISSSLAGMIGSGYDLNSVSIPPMFVSSFDLHATNPAMNDLGVSLPEVPIDIDGQVRSLSTPDIGADEYINVPAYSYVWPGDTDADLIVDNNDLLPLGLYYNATGAPRASASIVWVGQNSIDWGQLQASGIDVKHADCNGDGVVNSSDTLAITTNYSQTHLFAPVDNTVEKIATNPEYGTMGWI